MARKGRTTHFKVCETCGAEFSNFRVSATGKKCWERGQTWRERKYCSRGCIPSKIEKFKVCKACFATYSNVRRRGEVVVGYVKPEKWSKSLWCSKKCRWVTQGALRVVKNCLNCQQEFDNEILSGAKKGTYVNSKRFQMRRFCRVSCGLTFRQRRTSKQAFFSNIGEADENGCIQWLGYKQTSGHGKIELKDVDGRGILAHRLAYAIFKGPVPGNRLVCHACHNPSCVRAEHLYLGDYTQNAADRYRRERPKDAKDEATGWPSMEMRADGKLILTNG